jgi:ABC-type phosphate transport system substrate-binding protein
MLVGMSASPEWKEQAGVGVAVRWPTGVAENGNEGVAEKVKDTPGSIGYVELTYAYRKDLPFALVRNREGEFVRAGVGSAGVAAESLKDIPADLRFSLTDAPGKGAYPVCRTTWAVLRVSQSGTKGWRVIDFLKWATTDGQSHAESLLYVPLPESLRDRAQKQLDRVQQQSDRISKAGS